MVWPGLNAPVIQNRVVVRHQQLAKDENRQQRLIELREKMSQVKYPPMPPLLRGFTGGRMTGLRYGPPDPVGDCKAFCWILCSICQLNIYLPVHLNIF